MTLLLAVSEINNWRLITDGLFVVGVWRGICAALTDCFSSEFDVELRSTDSLSSEFDVELRRTDGLFLVGVWRGTCAAFICFGSRVSGLWIYFPTTVELPCGDVDTLPVVETLLVKLDHLLKNKLMITSLDRSPSGSICFFRFSTIQGR